MCSLPQHRDRPPAASGPPRSRSEARRTCDSAGGSRTRRSGRPRFEVRQHKDVDEFGAGSHTGALILPVAF